MDSYLANCWGRAYSELVASWHMVNHMTLCRSSQFSCSQLYSFCLCVMLHATPAAVNLWCDTMFRTLRTSVLYILKVVVWLLATWQSLCVILVQTVNFAFHDSRFLSIMAPLCVDCFFRIYVFPQIRITHILIQETQPQFPNFIIRVMLMVMIS
jgi:hypothetical protein